MNPILASGGDFDFIIFIVIMVIVGVVRLIKAAVGKAGKLQPKSAPGRPQPNAEDRMRKFLEQVVGAPVPPAAKPRRRRPAKRPAEPKPPEKPTPAPAPRVAASTPAAPLIPAAERKPPYRFDPSRLKGAESLRHAVVLREILGKPLALRRPGRVAMPGAHRPTASG